MIRIFKDYYLPKLYTEDEIIELGDILKELKGITLLNKNDFFKLVDYNIKSMEVEYFNWFSKNEKENMFYIDSITISNGEKEFKYSDDDPMCSDDGVMSLLDYKDTYVDMKDNYRAFSSQNMFVND